MDADVPKKILVVDDDPRWISIIAEEIVKIDQDVQVITANTKEQALAIIDSIGAGLFGVVSDLSLTEKGQEGFTIVLRAKRAGIPNVALHTANVSTSVGVFCVKEDIEHWSKGPNTENLQEWLFPEL